MLGRVLFRSNGILATWAPRCAVRQNSTAVSKEVADDAPVWVDRPERDLVNFPRPKQRINPSPVRMGFVPQGWFDMLYNKTGVTGPYMLGAGLITFLVSKELYVLEHEFYGGFCLFLTYTVAAKKFGPSVAEYLDKEIEEDNRKMDEGRAEAIAQQQETLANAKEGIESAKNHAILFDAKKENVALQLEASYRQRLQDVHNQVKKRLDYQLETSNVQTQFEQKHMINWIVGNVRESITPALQQASLKQCITDLKSLAAKA